MDRDVLDAEARRVWERLGFRVESIEGLTVSAMYGGSPNRNGTRSTS